MNTQPLTHPVHTLEWFEKKCQQKLRERASLGKSTLTEARNAVAQEYGLEDWQDVKQMSRNSGVFLDSSTIQFKRRIEKPVEEVWRYLVEPSLLSKWHFETEIDLKIGGRFNFKNAWSGKIGQLVTGKTIRFDAEKGGYIDFSISEDQGSIISESIDSPPTLPKAYSDSASTIFELIDHMVPHIAGDSESNVRDPSLQDQSVGSQLSLWYGVVSGWHHSVDTLANLLGDSKSQTSIRVLDHIYAKLLDSFHDVAS